MLMTRAPFDSVRGWDNGYLIGDFEDSDLCFKIREQGKHCVYVPTVELTHLERQSFNLTGAPDFRTKVVIDSSEIYLSLTGNHAKGSFGEPPLGEELFRCIKNSVNRIRLSHFIISASKQTSV